MAKLNWKLLTKKGGSPTQGIPSGKEDLAWVTNTVTLIYGERDAVLVDTFLSEEHSKELVDWVAESDNNTHPYLAECDEKARCEWLDALDKIEALHPNRVNPGSLWAAAKTAKGNAKASA